MADPPARPIEPSPPGSEPGTVDEPNAAPNVVEILAPSANARLVVGKKARFHAKATCPSATIELLADGQYVFATSTGPEIDVSYALASAGANRAITARAVSADPK